jgi:ASC-1-like (ASCH) protein
MDHLAIMYQRWGFIPKLLSGEKKLESRWYKDKRIPWNRVHRGDRIYFKDSGKPVTVTAKVKKVLQFENIDENKVKDLLKEHYKDIGISKDTLELFYLRLKERRYAILIYLENVKKIDEPFKIKKTGYGNMTSWITIDDIQRLVL